MLSFEEQQDLLSMNKNDIDIDLIRDGTWEDIDDADVTLSVPPPGEEGFFLSHAGGEFTLQQMFIDSMSKWYGILSLKNSMICKCETIMWSAGCCNRETSCPISSTLFFCSRPTAYAFHRPKIPGGTLRSSISKVHIVFEMLDLSTYLVI